MTLYGHDTVFCEVSLRLCSEGCMKFAKLFILKLRNNDRLQEMRYCQNA